jgi:hypothetical protein
MLKKLPSSTRVGEKNNGYKQDFFRIMLLTIIEYIVLQTSWKFLPNVGIKNGGVLTRLAITGLMVY